MTNTEEISSIDKKQEIIQFLNTKNIDSSVLESINKEIDIFISSSNLDEKPVLDKIHKIWKDKKQGNKNPFNSKLLYYLGVTSKKPEGDFQFKARRFFARPSPPDIDSDFDYIHRHEIVDYLVRTYGRGRVSNIGTYQSLKLKAALTRMIKALDLANAFDKGPKAFTTDNEAKSKEIKDSLPAQNGAKLKIKDENGEEHEIKTIQDAAKWCEDFAFYADKYPELLSHSKNIEGLLSSYSVHASGILVSDIPLEKIAPLRTAKEKGENISYATQFAYEDLELLGLIKYDILGISTLTVISETVKMIEQNYGIKIDVKNLPLDNKKTYDLYKSGKLTGVFQCEGHAMQKVCMDIKVSKFDDIMAAISLFRPGPMDSIKDYCARKHGEQPISYFHPSIEKYVKPILERSYGVLCVHGDTKVTMKDGSYKKISEIKNNDYVMSMDKYNKINSNKVLFSSPTVFGNGLKITLSNGESVCLTPNHKVYTPDGWVEIGNLSKGDLVASPYQLEQNTNKSPKIADWLGDNKDIAYLLGQLSGDGCVNSGVILYTGLAKPTKKIKKWIKHSLKKINIHQGFSERCWRLGLSCGDLVNKKEYGNRKTKLHLLLEELGYKKTDCYNKKVPEIILKGDNELKAAFLAGIIDSDGHISKKNCNISSVSDDLKYGIKLILQNFGIVYSSTKTHIIIYDHAKLKKIISPYLLLKNNFSKKPFNGETVGFYPKKYLLEKINNSKLSSRKFSKIYNISRSVFVTKKSKFKKIIDSKTANKCGFALGDIRFYKISNIEQIHNQQFYDISVENDHNFIGNNIILHNCYQEDIMSICAAFGMTVTDALIVIKGISKKKEDVIAKGRTKFVNGAISKDVPKDVAEQYWDKFITPFASYGFNCSHSGAYAYLSYQTAYLKANFPEEFMCSYLNVETERAKLEKTAILERDCRNFDITILPRNINLCGLKYEIVKKKDPANGIPYSEIRPPIDCKGLSSLAAENIVKNRPYNSIRDLAEKTDSSVDRSSVGALADAKFFKGKREKLIEEFEMYREDMKIRKRNGEDEATLF